MWYSNHVVSRREEPSRVDDWFGPVPQSSPAADGADPDVVDFHRWAAGEPPQRIRLASVGTLTRLNRKREQRS